MDIVFNGPLIHHLLLKEVEEPREDVISFDLLRKRVSCGKREFDLITELRHKMHRVDNDIPSRRLRARYFKDSVRVKCNELEKIFMEQGFDNDKDVVKVAIVYFIELAMTGKERKQTIWSVKNALKDKLPMYQQKTIDDPTHVETYSLYGFPYAIQVWAYKTTSTLSASSNEVE
ncbi:uncharacterized protein LOC111023081 [Momordica charantia]|uniref:Uncharacterized protein LOC111023081 n=1 Tax=Momordica charantia TaxID=3673 RepID=A0A6J1DR61_MOMCH|nr:uncharacterized protein LOC111023081 [Momordica charantia]